MLHNACYTHCCGMTMRSRPYMGNYPLSATRQNYGPRNFDSYAITYLNQRAAPSLSSSYDVAIDVVVVVVEYVIVVFVVVVEFRNYKVCNF